MSALQVDDTGTVTRCVGTARWFHITLALVPAGNGQLFATLFTNIFKFCKQKNICEKIWGGGNQGDIMNKEGVILLPGWSLLHAANALPALLPPF